MDEKNGKNYAQGHCQTEEGYPVNRLCPDDEFWAEGVSERKKGWLNTGLAFLKGRSSSELIVLGAILALWRIAHEFVQRGSSPDVLSFVGCLVISMMILAIALMVICKAVRQSDEKESQERRAETP
jgi:hypothetical protein